MSKTRETLVSPAGTVKFSHIDKPNTKFKPEGEYSVDLLLDPAAEGVQALLDGIKARAEKAKADSLKDAKDGKQKKARESYELYVPFSKDEDKDGNETGLIVLKAKNAATIKRKNGETFNKRINVFDAKKKPLVDAKIGRGSTLKIAFTPNAFCADGLKRVGVGLWLEAVQVIDLKTFGSGDADQYGFGEEDGYQADEETTTDAPASEGGSTVGTDNPDF